MSVLKLNILYKMHTAVREWLKFPVFFFFVVFFSIPDESCEPVQPAKSMRTHFGLLSVSFKKQR